VIYLQVETSLEIVVACFALHNLCIGVGDTEAPGQQQAGTGQPVYEDATTVHTDLGQLPSEMRCFMDISHRKGFLSDMFEQTIK